VLVEALEKLNQKFMEVKTMGQYHVVVNKTKKQFLRPHAFGDGLKLMEFGVRAYGTMAELAILLAKDNGSGVGDLDSENPVIGSWAGDEITISGDYGEDGFYNEVENNYKDISFEVLDALTDDEWILKELYSDITSNEYQKTTERGKFIIAKAVKKRIVEE
jgi:hypothetical protein